MKKTITKKIKILEVLVALICTASQTMYAQDTRTSCKWNEALETVECDTAAIRPEIRPDLSQAMFGIAPERADTTAQDTRTSCKWNEALETVECDTKAQKPAEEKDPMGTKTIQSIDAGYYRKLLPKENIDYSRSQQIQQEIEQVQQQQAQLFQQALRPKPLTEQDLQYLQQALQPQQQNPATNTTQAPPQQHPPATNTTQAPPSLPQNQGYAGYYVWQNPISKNKMLLSSEWVSGTVSPQSTCLVAGTFDCFNFTLFPRSQDPSLGITMGVDVVVAHTQNSAIDAETYADELTNRVVLLLKNFNFGSLQHSQSKYVSGVKIYEQQYTNGDKTMTLKYGNSIWLAWCSIKSTPDKIALSGPYQEICNRLASDVLMTALPQP